jgi:hypothetical protein
VEVGREFFERTQQFTLRWANSQTAPFGEIVRQQWNFNPRGSTMELEDYKVDLHHVLILGLTIDPDLGKGQAFAAVGNGLPFLNLSNDSHRDRMALNLGDWLSGLLFTLASFSELF